MTQQAEPLRSGWRPPLARRTWNSGVWAHFAWAALLPGLILLGWQLYTAYGEVNPILLPSPAAIAEALGTLTASGELAVQLGVSLGRAALGTLYGCAAALALGTLVGLSRLAAKLLDPSMQLLRLTPSLAIAPLIILWFGFGETSKIVIIATGAFFPLYLATIQSLRGVDGRLTEVARVLQFGRAQQLSRLLLPGAMPGLLSGLRLAMAYGWLSLVVAELLGAQAGIGYLMSHAQTNGHPAIIFVGVLVFAVMGKLIDLLVATVEKRVLRWRDSYAG
ncbi:ABC transporter permease [Paenibacillus sp. IB182496]|uniref:ABC transporter permease n=1 Tax=Paenibacillus sabuli TaxID=2772509 RepID=A0A927GTI0_9BACL|nr:ABC transporter permease [Paenibacillus sabuli]MBD2846752.1 ABC transporter permease [Paenibacillus sabuli]